MQKQLSLFGKPRFAIHKEKSILKPIQEIEFVFSSVTVKISITKEKTEAIASGF